MVRVGLIGYGQVGESYARVLGHLDHVELVASCGIPSIGGRVDCSHTNALSLLDEAPVEAVVFASPLGDAHAMVRRALLSRKHVLFSGPFTLNSQQVDRLAVLAQRAHCLLMFGEERFLSPGFAFLEQSVAAVDGFRRARHLRLLDVRVESRRGALSIGSLAIEDQAACLRLLRRTPQSVSAIACKGPRGNIETSFINMIFPAGAVVSLQVTLSEAAEAWQVVAALGSRTIILDDLDPRLPLRVITEGTGPSTKAAGATLPPEGDAWQTSSLAFTREPFDGPLAQVRHFFDALESPEGIHQKSNSELWSKAAVLWEAAESSMAQAGAPIPVQHWSVGAAARVRYRPSHLRVITGSNRSKATAASMGKRPALKVLTG